MSETLDLKQAVRDRVAQVVHQLQQEHDILRNLDQQTAIEEYSDGLLQFLSPEQALALPEVKIVAMIRDLMAFDSMAVRLDALTPEQVQQVEDRMQAQD
jgi:hypothetical protein